MIDFGMTHDEMDFKLNLIHYFDKIGRDNVETIFQESNIWLNERIREDKIKNGY